MTWPVAMALVAVWVAGLAVQALRLKRPRSVPKREARGPFVSVIVPARNEARNIERCVGSLAQSRWDEFELIVVDDQSDDGTGDLVRAMDRGRAKDVRVVDGRPLPPGWVGKPWACRQGAAVARGQWLLFTDADTWHEAGALARAAAAMEDDEADMLSVTGDQEMEGFWERLVQPHVIVMLMQALPRMDRPLPRRKWRRAVATGQYMLVKRTAYEELGGHEAVRDAVVEDLKLAQMFARDGRRVSIRDNLHGTSTRMYQSFGEIVRGWTKNLSLGARQTFGPVRGRLLLAGTLVGLPVFWMLPGAVLLAGAAGWVSGPALAWAGVAYAASAAMWAGACWVLSRRPWYGLIYPLAAVVVWGIVARSVARSSRVTWKGRDYQAPPPT